jgi:Rhodopirellula transposase DDE domain
MSVLTNLKDAVCFAVDQLSGSARRLFLGKTLEGLPDVSQREFARVIGCDRETLRKAVAEIHSERPGVDQRQSNGRKPSVILRFPLLMTDLREIIEPHIQTDPKFTSTRLYCRLSVRQIVKALVDTRQYKAEELPSDEFFRRLINDMGYGLKKVRKCKPAKKVVEADQIFETIQGLNSMADACEDDQTLRVSLDTKARVNVGEFSRGGYSRVERKALDHDFDPDFVLVPIGIMVPKYNEVYIDIVFDRAPADAWVDSLDRFWEQQAHRFPNTRQLLLNLDNGPENNSHRTQFMARLVDFANRTGLVLTLAYYPPYQSKYNAIERAWGILENHWSAELLDSVDAVIGFASTMTYNGIRAVVHLVQKIYERGVSVSKEAMLEVNSQLFRAEGIPKYLVTIIPKQAARLE